MSHRSRIWAEVNRCPLSETKQKHTNIFVIHSKIQVYALQDIKSSGCIGGGSNYDFIDVSGCLVEQSS